MIGALLRLLGVEEKDCRSNGTCREQEGKDEFQRALYRVEEATARADGRRPPTWEDFFTSDRVRQHES
jgi:hypothetical protein